MKPLLIAGVLLGLSACSDAPTTKREPEAVRPALSALELRRTERVAAMAAGHDGGISFKDQFNALDPRIKRSAVERGSSFDPSDDYWGLPRTEGHEEVAASCAACHSLAIVMQQRVTPERWQYLLKWMVDKQGMQPMDSTETALVEAYLVRHFSSTAAE